ncbi:MAG: response regulator [Cyanobacteria bacterium P01_D01_bin.1]
MSTHILLIEDSPTDAAILVAAFESIGYLGKIEVAKSGLEAINILGTIEATSEQVWPRLILLDLNLPRRSGLEVLDDIKTNPVWMSIPTVVLSSSSAPTDIINSYKRHANAYISKPRQLTHYEAVAKQLYSFWIETAQSPCC